VQAVPLVLSAALGHLIFGDVQFGITLPLLLGAVPGAYLGAKISSSAPQGIIRRVLAIVLSISGLKLLGVSTEALAYVIVAIVVLGPALWMLIRVREGLPALGSTEGKIVDARISAGSTDPLSRKPPRPDAPPGGLDAPAVEPTSTTGPAPGDRPERE